MNDDLMLRLHCPQCAQLTDVVAEGDNLVCLECGWKFDEQVAAKFMSRETVPGPPPRPAS